MICPRCDYTAAVLWLTCPMCQAIDWYQLRLVVMAGISEDTLVQAVVSEPAESTGVTAGEEQR